MNRREALAALVAMPEIARISKANVKPDDVIVVEVPERISLDQAEYIRTSLQKIWPEPQRIVVLLEGATLKVVSS